MRTAAKKEIHVAYISRYDVHDRRTWSGIPHAFWRELRGHFDRVDLLPAVRGRWDTLLKAKTCALRLSGRQHIRQYEPASLRSLGRQLRTWLDGVQPDLVFTDTSIVAAVLDGRPPIALWMDSHLAAMDGYYDYFSNLSAATRRQGMAVEQTAFAKAALVLFASQWAADSAVEAYSVDAGKVHVLPFGANLAITHDKADVAAMVDRRGSDPIVLTFLGVDWKRKGGQLALQVVRRLNTAGVAARLDVIGCRLPAEAASDDRVREVGFLDKTNPRDEARLRHHLAQSHFLILPSRSECFGIVFAEASAYGVPSLARRSGGIPSAVRDGVNGRLFAPDAGPDAYVEAIMELIRSPAAYRALALSAFGAYQARLNWPASFRKLRGLVHDVVSPFAPPACEVVPQ